MIRSLSRAARRRISLIARVPHSICIPLFTLFIFSIREQAVKGVEDRPGGRGNFLYLGAAAVETLLAIRPEDAVIDGSTPVFGLHPDTIRRRLQQAARRRTPRMAGNLRTLGSDWDEPRPGRRGIRSPRADDGRPVKSPRMPARYTERQAAGRGAVARYYQGSRG